MFNGKVMDSNHSLLGSDTPIMVGRTRVLGARVRYAMRRVDREAYEFCISYRGEAVRCGVKCGRSDANKIFFSLLRGRVTPCSASYVIRELADDLKICMLADI